MTGPPANFSHQHLKFCDTWHFGAPINALTSQCAWLNRYYTSNYLAVSLCVQRIGSYPEVGKSGHEIEIFDVVLGRHRPGAYASLWPNLETESFTNVHRWCVPGVSPKNQEFLNKP